MLDEFLARAAWYTDDSIKAYVALTVIFAIAYRALYKLFDRAVAPLSAAYRNLSRADQIEWNSRMISNVNAFTTAVLGIMDVCGALLRGSDIILASTPMACLKLSLLGGYLLHDLELVLAYENLCTKEMVLHHLIGLIGNGLSILWRQYHMLCMCFMQTEATTPFINARWFLTKSGQRLGLLYNLNGGAIFISWTLFRMLPIPFQVSRLYFDFDNLIAAGGPAPFVTAVTVVVLVAVLNTKWYYLIFRGFFKLLSEVRSAKPDSSSDAKQR